jgi:integrase
MPVVKRCGRYQAKILSPDKKFTICKTFATRAEAEEQLARWTREKRQEKLKALEPKLPILDDFFSEWFTDVSSEKSTPYQSGWREFQFQQYRDYVQPVLGSIRIDKISPQLVKRVLNRMATLDRAPGTQSHVFVLMRKMFGDAIESYQYLTFNPAIRKLKPEVPINEAKRLNLGQIRKLLLHVEGKKYGLAMWLQLYVGLRCGELQALRWEDIDLQDGRLYIRRTFVRKMAQFRDYPKGRRQHSHTIPPELCAQLGASKSVAKGELVAPSPRNPKLVLPQRWYGKALKGYCRELGLPLLGTHGLRHSTSEIYLSHGASRDDLRQLFAHSSSTVTDRYVRDHASNLERVSSVVRLFKSESGSEMNQKNEPNEKEEVPVSSK